MSKVLETRIFLYTNNAPGGLGLVAFGAQVLEKGFLAIYCG
jgi:hypothetical protein